ncbi:hypothetical protein PVAP13_8NG104302 [Panicum virgatum]|uniref:Uncharacterized protein n=1 Tax=Panicum virgatum TaxID=38727 RepID=A0A8T0PFJ2_PANVG|nr:hypothetical protein PVAP13_8NG104302 [Panicum virgatum]
MSEPLHHPKDIAAATSELDCGRWVTELDLPNLPCINRPEQTPGSRSCFGAAARRRNPPPRNLRPPPREMTLPRFW